MARNTLFNRLLNLMRTRYKEREEKAFVASLPPPYAEFMKRYTPENENDAQLFNRTKDILIKTGQRNIKNYLEDFAQIGDVPLLEHLWNISGKNDPDLGEIILNNPNCSKEIVLEAIANSYGGVAEPALRSPLLSSKDLLQAVYRIDRTCYTAFEVLNERLNNMGYRVDWNPWLHDEPLIYKVLDKDTEVPLDMNFNPTKPMSLDNMILNAQERSEAQGTSHVKTSTKNFPVYDNPYER